MWPPQRVLLLAQFIDNQLSKKEFYEFFQGKYSEGFNPEEDLKKVGVVNQTTMLASETHEISQYFKYWESTIC